MRDNVHWLYGSSFSIHQYLFWRSKFSYILWWKSELKFMKLHPGNQWGMDLGQDKVRVRRPEEAAPDVPLREGRIGESQENQLGRRSHHRLLHGKFILSQWKMFQGHIFLTRYTCSIFDIWTGTFEAALINLQVQWIWLSWIITSIVISL